MVPAMLRSLCMPLSALLLLAVPATAQEGGDDGWIDADDGGGDEGGEWIDVPAEEAAPAGDGASPAEGEGEGGDGWVDANEADTQPAPPAPAEPPPPPAPDPAEAPLTCPAIAIPRPAQPKTPEALERVLVLPLKDAANKAEEADALTTATATALTVIKDLDYTDPGQITRDEDDALIKPPPAEPIPTDRLRFEVVDSRCLEGKVPIEAWEGFTECSRGSCMGDLAEATSADWIVYGQLANAAPPLLLYEVKLFNAELGRIVSRSSAEAPNARFLTAAVPAVLAQLIEDPPPPPPRPAPPKEPSLLESPLLIGGTTLLLAGGVLALGAAGWLASAEATLWVPEVSRALKTDALTYWPYVAGALAVSPLIIAAGVVLMGISPLFLPDVEQTPAPSDGAEE
jgi:hypothetical protein